VNFAFSDEQELLRSEARKLLDAQGSIKQVREFVETPEGYSPEIWKQLGELGWLGLAIPETHGGGGLGWEELVILLEETGRTLFPSPLVSTLLTGELITRFGNDAQRERWLPGLASGSRVGTLAFLEESGQWDTDDVSLTAVRDGSEGEEYLLEGEKCFVQDATSADLFAVVFRWPKEAGGELGILMLDRDTAGVSVEPLDPMDTTKRVGTLKLSGVPLPSEALLSGGTPAVLRVLELGALAVASEIVGTAEGALALTVQYAKDREQFGQKIGHFQGVKHPLAELYMEIETLKSLVYFAAWALDHDDEGTALAISQAKAYASEVITRAGVTGIQLHGAVGYTAEYDIQLYLKRSKWARPMFGDEYHHYERAATLGGL
jgi:alkylation response protein AidB-like acyl-CoA dehydrogenase